MSVVEKGKKNHLNCLIFFIKRVDTLQEREKKNQSEDDCQMNSVADGTICID
jgi:hypothetical protein